jgi:hypothetical protein
VEIILYFFPKINYLKTIDLVVVLFQISNTIVVSTLVASAKKNLLKLKMMKISNFTSILKNHFCEGN